MKLQFRSNDREGPLWQQRTAQRMRQALERLHGLVARIKVRLDDLNGPAGGIDKRCDVEVFMRSSKPVAISATARTWQDSVDAVACRLRQRFVLQLHRATVMAHQPVTLLPVHAQPVAPAAGARSLRRLRHA